jgi:hypothetical protein
MYEVTKYTWKATYIIKACSSMRVVFTLFFIVLIISNTPFSWKDTPHITHTMFTYGYTFPTVFTDR